MKSRWVICLFVLWFPEIKNQYGSAIYVKEIILKFLFEYLKNKKFKVVT